MGGQWVGSEQIDGGPGKYSGGQSGGNSEPQSPGEGHISPSRQQCLFFLRVSCTLELVRCFRMSSFTFLPSP